MGVTPFNLAALLAEPVYSGVTLADQHSLGGAS